MACTDHSSTSQCTSHLATTTCTSHLATTTCTAHSNTTPCTSHSATTICAAHTATSSCPVHSTLGCPSHAGKIAPVTPTSWTDPSLTGVPIKSQHINELRTAIANENVRRSAGASIPAAVSVGGTVDNATIIAMRTALNLFGPWSAHASLNLTNLEEGDLVQNEQIESLRSGVNTFESQCACNCNYACTCQCDYVCTCNCNYACTCQCNYGCTCQCNYGCTCQCNYACTCQCNYACTCNCNY